MAHLGTGVQIAAVGPQNQFLDLRPEVGLFDHSVTRSTRFASEYVEDLPLQTARFGGTAVFEMPPRGDLLGRMHVEFRIPAVQPRLGEMPPETAPPVVAPPTVPAPAPLPLEQAVQGFQGVAGGVAFSVSLQGFQGVATSARNMVGGGGRVWTLQGVGDEMWQFAVYSTGRVVSTLTGPRDRTLSLEVQGATTSVAQPAGRSVGLFIKPSGEVVTRNDAWASPLAYVLMRRVRLVVDDLVVHDHERMWYDLHDRVASREMQARALAGILGTDLSMGVAHTVCLPLKFLSEGRPRAYFPIIMVPKTRTKVELQLEGFAGCVPSAPGLEPSQPSSLDVRLVGERIILESDERNAMLLRPLTIMYEGAQDMDALNYVETNDGTLSKTGMLNVDLSELNLPVKALLWVVYEESTRRLFDYLDVVDTATLQFGSQERVLAQGPTFSRQQVHSHATRCLPGNVYMYSFALQAWGKEPCGAVDFSLVQKPTLRLTLKPEAAALQLKCKVWGLTYNWLTFQGGKVTRMFST